MDIQNHWLYFLSLEKEFANTLRFVEYNQSQKQVYSFEYARLIILICSELDVVLEVFCESIDSRANAQSIGNYFQVLRGKYQLTNEVIKVPRLSEDVAPFSNWNDGNSPEWWAVYNKIKHHRHREFERASAQNALTALCGLFIANLFLLNEYDLIGSVSDTPLILARENEPDVIEWSSGYGVELLNS